MNVNEITEKIIGAAITVHRALGPGLLESAYEACFAIELKNRELAVEQQQPNPSRTAIFRSPVPTASTY